MTCLCHARSRTHIDFGGPDRPTGLALCFAACPKQSLLIWITRGQGVLLLNGTRRGVGTHNLIYVPAGALFALEAGRQTMGQVAICPPDLGTLLPENARQLRIRDAGAISELTGLFEVAQREATGQRPFFEDALVAHMGLISVWLRRQLAMPENAQSKRNAAARLSDSFCARLRPLMPLF